LRAKAAGFPAAFRFGYARRNNRKTSLYLQFTLGRPLSFRYNSVKATGSMRVLQGVSRISIIYQWNFKLTVYTTVILAII